MLVLKRSVLLRGYKQGEENQVHLLEETFTNDKASLVKCPLLEVSTGLWAPGSRAATCCTGCRVGITQLSAGPLANSQTGAGRAGPSAPALLLRAQVFPTSGAHSLCWP